VFNGPVEIVPLLEIDEEGDRWGETEFVLGRTVEEN
jgi:hypothetical protein